ncbi:hypothetical protein B0H67DRAFT_498366 [Lasiosphaeris hirsuta]|uniref:DUF726-domain-containing protein n=1 Tax=Lasiosphaeris hirsuta TaxID=260670 RepID=A0AA39ZWP2_9PEZI|nr:hypothetical protein B0H67DRAFT_498366 [Lasiosphaeris hirsuta]
MEVSKDQKGSFSPILDPQEAQGNNSSTPIASPEGSPLLQPLLDDSTVDMAPGGKQRPNTPKREVDLSSLLTVAERNELVSFVAKATDTVQKQICQVFDSTGIIDNPGLSRISYWSKLPAHLRDLSLSKPQMRPEPRQSASRKENAKPGIDPKNTAFAANSAEGSAGSASTQQDPQRTGPRLAELKREALQHFKKWQTAIHKRVGDINVKKGNEAQNGQSSGGFRRGSSSRNRPNTASSKNAAIVEADPALLRLYPPTPTTLCSLPADKKVLLLHSLLLLILSFEQYGAYSRVLMLNITSSLHLTLRILAEEEVRVAKSLAQLSKDINPDAILQKKSEEGKSAKKWKIGMAGAAGAAASGMTGALAAPLLAAGIGSVLGGIGIGSTATANLLGVLGESGLIVGSLFGIYGVRATGKMMEQYVKDIQDFVFVPIRGSIGEDSEIGKVTTETRRLRVVLGISGWLTNESDVTSPWRVLGQQSEVYAVQWELEPLMKMGAALDTVIKSSAWSLAKKEINARTSMLSSKPPSQDPQETTNKSGPVFACLTRAIWPVGLLKISKIIDNHWNVAMVRADKVGGVLADVIMNKAHGDRGISLIGYSLGARVIYACLMILAERRAFGLVENVVMMGTPAPSDADVWCAMKAVVSGRLVNVYSQNDYILGFLYRMSSIDYGVAGLQRIEGIDGVENVDVSAKVSSHMRYQFLAGSILKHIAWEDIDRDQVATDEVTLAAVEQKNREREQIRNGIDPGAEAKQKGKEVKAKNDQDVIRTRIRKSKGKKGSA